MQNPCCRILLVGLAVLLVAAPSRAAETAVVGKTRSVNTEDPIDISADESLEWYKDKGLYVARGKAKAIVRDTTIEADILTAHQREKGAKDAGGTNIDRLTAEGVVRIFNDKQQAVGDVAVYDVDRRIFRMTGAGLRYVSGKNVVTAKDSFEFYENDNVAVARGRAVAEHEGSRLEADVLTAHFARDANEEMDMDKMTAKGNVIIVTKDGGVARGARAVYDVKRDVAVLMDQVRITRGNTQLAGSRAEVDFKSGQSRLLSGGGGRVRVLLPSSRMPTGKGTP